jgi:hypothetical protein
MLSSWSRVGVRLGSVTVDGGTGMATGVTLGGSGAAALAGSCGGGALFTSRPSFSIRRWSRGGGTGLAGVPLVPDTRLLGGGYRGGVLVRATKDSGTSTAISRCGPPCCCNSSSYSATMFIMMVCC